MSNLRDLERAATPAPWFAEDKHPYGDALRPNTIVTETGGAIAGVYWRVRDAGEPDASFIAALRNAAPLLLDVVDAARPVEETLSRKGSVQIDQWRRLRDALAVLNEAMK
jgi:hypothetical protein